MLEVKFVWAPKDKDTQKTDLPAYQYPGDAGLDLKSTVDFTLAPGQVKLIPVGWAIELPRGYEGQIRPRSGLAWQNVVTVLNAPGTIDEGYRDEMKVMLINHGQEEYKGKAGDRIAQLVIMPVPRVRPIETTSLSSSARGKDGFGSSGK